ncbi:unnamed protein product [Gongylonema pulchrum]|uniref:Ropporin-1-like protein n=1 Tax=Gongylonema pulchrum TaxID=637853 RepID=A0A183EDG3_9BILA|nr:unnamed protein product [Gongylonema pulchrum]
MEERGVLDSLRKNDKSEVLPLVSSSLKGKPKIEIYVDNSPDALEKERALLAQDFLSQQKVETAISFLYKVLPNLMQGTLATSWESYGIVIGKRGDRISPLDLVEWIVKDPPAGPDKSEEIHTPSKMPSDLAIVAKCLMVYRIGSVPAAHFEYVEKLTDRMAVLYSQQPGCATIPSIKKIAKAMKMKHSELITYAFDERIVDDMGWVQENWEKEEIDKRDSYFPYLKELQIVPRSPYSLLRRIAKRRCEGGRPDTSIFRGIPPTYVDYPVNPASLVSV